LDWHSSPASSRALPLFGVLLLTDNFTYFNRFAGQAPFDL
jgi:hypothetical protein